MKLIIILIILAIIFNRLNANQEDFTLIRGCEQDYKILTSNKTILTELINNIKQDDEELSNLDPRQPVEIENKLWRPSAMTLNEAREIKGCDECKIKSDYIGLIPTIYREGTSYEYPTF